MKTQLEKTEKVECQFTYDGWDWRNKVTIKSITGRTIYLTAYFGDSVSEELKELFTHLDRAWKDATYGSGVQKVKLMISKQAMQEALSASVSGWSK